MRSFALGGNNLSNVLDQMNTNGKLHSANQMVPSAGAYGYWKCPKSRSEPDFGPECRVQRLDAYPAISASSQLLAYLLAVFKSYPVGSIRPSLKADEAAVCLEQPVRLP